MLVAEDRLNQDEAFEVAHEFTIWYVALTRSEGWVAGMNQLDMLTIRVAQRLPGFCEGADIHHAHLRVP